MNNSIKNKYIEPKIYNFKAWIKITESKKLYDSLNKLLEKSGYTILNFIEHKFPNGGYTCLWLLAESHLAIHTFINNNKTYVELSGCNKNMNKIFETEFNKYFLKQ